MKISNCGYDYRHNSDYTAERPFGSSGHILLIVRSPARIILHDREYLTKGNCVVLYHKETPQFFYAHNSEFVNDWVRFDTDEADFAFFDRIGLQFDTIAEYTDVYPLSRIVKQLSSEMWSSNPNAEESKTLLLHYLFLKLSDYNSRQTVMISKLTEKLTILRNNIYSTPQNDWSINTICKSLSISASYLQHQYKKFFGNSIKDDITASRIEYSKKLLANTDHTIAVIARMAGYANDLTFMHIFKEKTGFTPSQYRKSCGTYFTFS